MTSQKWLPGRKCLCLPRDPSSNINPLISTVISLVYNPFCVQAPKVSFIDRVLPSENLGRQWIYHPRFCISYKFLLTKKPSRRKKDFRSIHFRVCLLRRLYREAKNLTPRVICKIKQVCFDLVRKTFSNSKIDYVFFFFLRTHKMNNFIPFLWCFRSCYKIMFSIWVDLHTHVYISSI